MQTTSPHHWLTETPEERLKKEMDYYTEWQRELTEDRTGRLHDDLGRFASDDLENLQPNAKQLFWESLKEWGELLGFFSIEWKETTEDVWGAYVPRVRVGKAAWGVLAFATFELIRYIAK